MDIEDIARTAHEVNRAYCKAIGEDTQPSWFDAPQWQKNSALAGVRAHQAGNLTPRQSHESWLAVKAAEGWKYGRSKNVNTKEHPWFLPYDELPMEQRTKDYLFKAVVESLSY